MKRSAAVIVMVLVIGGCGGDDDDSLDTRAEQTCQEMDADGVTRDDAEEILYSETLEAVQADEKDFMVEVRNECGDLLKEVAPEAYEQAG